MTSEFGSSVIVSHGMTSPVEARVTMPDGPGQTANGDAGALAAAYFQLGYADLWGETKSNPDSAMSYSAYFACVRCIVNSFVSVCWHTYERTADGRKKLPLHDDVSWLLDFQANPEMSAKDWRGVMMKDALTQGNGISEIERTGNGKPAALWRIDPTRVQLVRDDTGQLWYEIANGTGNPPSYLHPEDVFHLKGLSPDGLWGWSVAKLAKLTTKLGLSLERFGEQFFSRGPTPGGIVTIPGNLNDQQRKEYQRSFEGMYSGSRNSHKIVVLSGGVTFTPSVLPNDDSQFLESRTHQLGEVARWFGVPPSKLADLQHVNFSIAEELEIQYVKDALLPWACRLESEGNIKLYGRTSRGRRFTKLSLDSLLRGNSAAQTDAVTRRVNGGIMTPNEGREYLDLNPDENGDELLVQGAMTTLDRVIAGETKSITNPPTPDPKEKTPAPTPTPTPAATDDVRRTFVGLLTDVYARLYRVDLDKAKRATNKGQLVAHAAEWYAIPQATERVQAALLPVMEGACLAAGLPIMLASPHAHAAAWAHVVRCRHDVLDADGAGIEGWESRPAGVAADDVERLIGGTK